MSNVKQITGMQFAQGFIESANLEQLRDLCAHIGVRLFALEKECDGMKASNLNEAANFITDSVRDIQGAINEDNNELPYCAACSGSGQGQYEGTTCFLCKGTGTERRAA